MKGAGWITAIIVVVLLAIIGSCSTSEYEEAGNTFSEWSKRSPSTWSNTQKDYFNNFWEWSMDN